MEKKDSKNITWVDIIIIGVALFVANVLENMLHIENEILSFCAFIGFSAVLFFAFYYIKYLMDSSNRS